MNLLILDDHPLVCSGIRSILISEQEITDVKQANDIKTALYIMSCNAIDLVLVDMKLKDQSGIDFVNSAKKTYPNCKYVILSSSSANEDFDRAISAEVDGYILKDSYPEDIVYAVKSVLKGRKYFDPLFIENKTSHVSENTNDPLSPRETEILECLGLGMSNKDIAQKLYISESTVKKHVSSILAKLNLNDRTQAALYTKKYD